MWSSARSSVDDMDQMQVRDLAKDPTRIDSPSGQANGRYQRILVLRTRASYRSDPARPGPLRRADLLLMDGKPAWSAGSEVLVAVWFLVDLDQGVAATSGARLALPSIIRRAHQCRRH